MKLIRTAHKSKLDDTSPPLKLVLGFEIRWDRFSHSELVDLSR